MDSRRHQLIQEACLRGLLPPDGLEGRHKLFRRNLVLSWLARRQQAEIRKGILLPLMLTIPGRAATGGPDLTAFIGSMQRMWGLAVRLEAGDISAEQEWYTEQEMSDPQKKLLEIFEKLDAAGLMELQPGELDEGEGDA